jgi:cell division protein FtsW
MAITRSDQSVLGRWWWTVDHWTLGAIAALIVAGVLLIQAASPPVALRIGQEGLYFVWRHLMWLTPAVMIMVALSLMTPSQIRIFALVLLVVSLFMVLATHFAGVEIKGARRWLRIAGFSIQPTEFLKPCFIILCARLFSRHTEVPNFPGHLLAVILYALSISLIVTQPDMGMSALISVVFAAQLLLSGVSIWLITGLAGIGAVGAGAAYFLIPHFQSRIDRFLNPDSGDTYQIDKSLEAFQSGGWLGVGPGEGQIKMSIPDAHADFIFSVAGEEFGLISCLVVVGLFAFIVLRGFWRLKTESNLFIFLAVSGLLVEFGLQAIINMGSALHILPTKGMTLPFISYGGSSLLALSVSAGMLLALTRRHYGQNI